MPVVITSENFDSEVMSSDIPVLIDFWATWCGPCRSLAPVVDELESELEGKVKVAKCDVDNEPEIAQKYGVMSIPTLVLIKEGKVSGTSIGFRPKDSIKNILGI